MIIKFTNGKTLEYISCYALETDYHIVGDTDVKRSSLTFHISPEVITFNELVEILNDTTNLKEITLIGDTPAPVAIYSGELDELGNPIISHFETFETPTTVHRGYDIKGKITVDENEITFKLYKKSDLELENEEAIATIDTLLMALEG